MPSSAMTWARQHRITEFPNRSFEPNASSTKTGHRGECGTCYVYLGNKDTCFLKCSAKSLLHSYKLAVVPSFYIFWLTSSFLEHVHRLKCLTWKMSYGRRDFLP